MHHYVWPSHPSQTGLLSILHYPQPLPLWKVRSCLYQLPHYDRHQTQLCFIRQPYFYTYREEHINAIYIQIHNLLALPIKFHCRWLSLHVPAVTSFLPALHMPFLYCRFAQIFLQNSQLQALLLYRFLPRFLLFFFSVCCTLIFFLGSAAPSFTFLCIKPDGRQCGSVLFTTSFGPQDYRLLFIEDLVHKSFLLTSRVLLCDFSTFLALPVSATLFCTFMT